MSTTLHSSLIPRGQPLRKPVKGEYRAEKLATRDAVVAAEDRAKLAAKVRDGYRCRVPDCTTDTKRWRLEGAHLANAGMGGNPDGSRGSERWHYVTLCWKCHQGERSIHSHDLVMTAQTDRGGDGPVLFERVTEAGKVAIGVSEP